MRTELHPDLLMCPACQHNNLNDARFCNRCGINLRHDPSLEPAANSKAPLHSADTDRPEDPLAHVADPLIGVVVAERYRILEPIGRGGMGVVYKVEHARIGKLMALKLLTGELSRDANLVARFKREALMASKLSHPNTVQVFDFGAAEGLTYLAMEYLRGDDLGRIIRSKGPLNPARTAKIVVQICSSLAEAHEKGIVHRDLKPENIMILRGQSGDDVVKVLDFGLAKLRESSELGDVTTRGAIVGTPYYMSPEQVRGEPVEPRSDIYSLGALMYTALTACPVFDAATPMAILARHLTEKAISPARRFPQLGISHTIGSIVLKALAKDPEQRFQSVRTLQQALVDELRGQGQVSVDELLDSGQLRELARSEEAAATRDEVERYERKLRRRGLLASAAAGLLSCAALVLGWRVWSSSQAELPFSGKELEPNNAASQARVLPFGAEVQAQIGRRIDETRSDRDFYRLDVPAGVAVVRIETGALPNMALCTLLYQVGMDSPIGRYCPGRPAMNLVIPALELGPGSYLLGVMQDREQYGPEPAPPVYENISDSYTLRIARAEGRSNQEVEPNDTVRDAQLIQPGQRLRGRLSWMRDTDVFCAAQGTDSLRFVVEDASARKERSVLEVTPYGGPADRIPVRIHHSALGSGASERDVPSPWKGPDTDYAPSKACLALKLVPDPLAPTPHPYVARASNDEYSVGVEDR